MPLPELVLDDRRFSDLTSALLDIVPGQSRNWNDFNLSDPGITLVELWCWIADMLLYRMDRVSQRSRLNFLKLVLDPPQPVTAETTLRLLPQLGPIVIPAGVRFQAMVSPPDMLEFETFATTIAGQDLSPPGVVDVSFSVRSRVVVENEFLGISNGERDQIFYLRQAPVLTDENNVGTFPGDYNPNPLVTVDGVPWHFVPDFLSSTTGPSSQQYMVEKLTGGVRFGNHLKGMVPPSGARIIALRYQIVRGREVRIGADSLLLAGALPGITSDEVVEIHNLAAEGGEYIFPAAEAESVGLPLFEEEWRAITQADFATAIVEQFNRAQDSVPNPPALSDLIERLWIVPGKDLESGLPPFAAEPGVISVVIMPKPTAASDVLLAPSTTLREKAKRFLEARRLITTRILVVGPAYVPVSLSLEVAGEPGSDTAQVASAIDAQIRRFLHPLTGGDQGAGWPVGRDVHKSELFQQVESVAGVDFAKRILINGDAAQMTVVLNENELPVVTPLSGQIPVAITT